MSPPSVVQTVSFFGSAVMKTGMPKASEDLAGMVVASLWCFGQSFLVGTPIPKPYPDGTKQREHKQPGHDRHVPYIGSS